MSPEERDDEMLQEYLEGDSALSRLYRRDAREQPDARLDARIRARARDAVAQNSPVAHSPFARHWMVPTSLAAVFVLSVSVVLLMPEPAVEPGGEIDGEVGGTAETATDSAIMSDAPPGAADGEQPPAAMSAPAPAPRQAAKRREQASQNRGVSGAGTPSSPPAALESAGQAAPDPLPIPAGAVQDDPHAWLRFIEALLDGQNRDAAQSNLRAFRSRYPDFPLPATLMALAASLDAQ